MPSPRAVRIEHVFSATTEVTDLISELDRELSLHYPPEQQHGLTLDEIFQPHVRFFVAWVADRTAGCGAVALFSGFAEVKRMYVRPALRGSGVADAIMGRLEAETIAAGLRALRLETGIHQPAALRFYSRHGFRPCGIFEPYSSMPPENIAASVFLKKRLSPP